MGCMCIHLRERPCGAGVPLVPLAWLRHVRVSIDPTPADGAREEGEEREEGRKRKEGRGGGEGRGWEMRGRAGERGKGAGGEGLGEGVVSVWKEKKRK